MSPSVAQRLASLGRRVRCIVATAATFAAATTTPSVYADDGKLAAPEYGRPAPRTTVGDALLWGPRVLLFPPYLVSEYVVRRPLGALITAAEKGHWPTALYDFFTFNDHSAGVVPTALFDFGLKPSVGLYFFYDNAFAKNNALRAHVATWGRDWLVGTFADRYAWNSGRQSISLRFEGVRRADLPYYGMGPDSRSESLSRYAIQRVDAGPVFESAFWRSSALVTAFGVRSLGFRDAGCCSDPALSSLVASGAVAPPPGYGQTYTVLYAHNAIAIDSRKPRPAPGSGLRLEANADPTFEVDHTGPARSWIRYGGALGASVDVNGRQRVVSLTVGAQLVDPLLKNAVIPFTEQVTLGGTAPMRGYLLGRLVDRSAAYANLQYTWPVWIYLDGTLRAEIGNVFGEHLSGFETKRLRLSSGMGIRTNTSRDHTFELLVAAGTETFEQGMGIDTVRIVLGGSSGF